jgi:hypothetical protein
MKKAHKNKKVYLIEPKAHGNGGWHGQSTIAYERLGKLLTINPYYEFGDELDYNIQTANWYGAELRICLTEDANDSIYVFDCEDTYQWESTR